MGRLSLFRKAKEVGVVTESYPFRPAEVPEGFRGRPVIDHDKCIGCGTCTRVCPANAVTMHDEEGYRIVRMFWGRCIFCARCADSCPEGAITMTKEFELTADDPEELVQEVRLKMAQCPVCGAYFDTERRIKRTIEMMKRRGIKVDEGKMRRCPKHRR